MHVLSSVGLLALIAVGSASPLEKSLVSRQKCTDQSCEIADISGSTGATTYNYPTYPTGDTQAGDCCIIRYRPSIADQIYAARPNLKAYCAKNPNAGSNIVATSFTSGAVAERSLANDNIPRGMSIYDFTTESHAEAMSSPAVDKRLACKDHILIFSKGTFETGTTGNFVGPQLVSALNKDAPGVWQVRTVSYTNSLNGDYCLGLPGGVQGKKLLEKTVAQCPKSTIVLAGYSQGAMVIRNALGNSTAEIASHVKVSSCQHNNATSTTMLDCQLIKTREFSRLEIRSMAQKSNTTAGLSLLTVLLETAYALATST